MLAGLKPYAAMKNSGVPWLGMVPEHWEVRRLKHAAQLNPSRVEAYEALNVDPLVTFLPMERVGTDGGLDLSDKRTASSVSNGFTYFRRNDVIVAKITPCFENGKGAWLDSLPTEIGFGSTEFHVLRARPNVLPSFLYRLTTAVDFRRLGADAMTGAAGQQRVPQSFIENFVFPLPPLTEQAAIVRFLDHADRRIRRYIRAKQKLIKLLKEHKQVIIHRAVTGGLDPNVRLKPSGVEWLGDVPEHWEIRRNGRLFAQRNETGFPKLPILEVSLKTGVRVRDFASSDRKQVMSDREKYKRAAAGDIAYNMMRMWQGAVGIAPVDGLVSPAYVVARALPGVEPRYFAHLFRIPAYMEEVDKYSRGIVKDRNRLYWEDFKQIPSCYPPFPEQVAIAEAIAELAVGIDAVVAQVRRQISFVREYRTRLIADTVTGKFDVRGAATQLPAEPEEPEPLDEAATDVEQDEADGSLEEIQV